MPYAASARSLRDAELVKAPQDSSAFSRPQVTLAAAKMGGGKFVSPSTAIRQLHADNHARLQACQHQQLPMDLGSDDSENETGLAITSSRRKGDLEQGRLPHSKSTTKHHLEEMIKTTQPNDDAPPPSDSDTGIESGNDGLVETRLHERKQKKKQPSALRKAATRIMNARMFATKSKADMMQIKDAVGGGQRGSMLHIVKRKALRTTLLGPSSELLQAFDEAQQEDTPQVKVAAELSIFLVVTAYVVISAYVRLASIEKEDGLLIGCAAAVLVIGLAACSSMLWNNIEMKQANLLVRKALFRKLVAVLLVRTAVELLSPRPGLERSHALTSVCFLLGHLFFASFDILRTLTHRFRLCFTMLILLANLSYALDTLFFERGQVLFENDHGVLTQTSLKLTATQGFILACIPAFITASRDSENLYFMLAHGFVLKYDIDRTTMLDREHEDEEDVELRARHASAEERWRGWPSPIEMLLLFACFLFVVSVVGQAFDWGLLDSTGHETGLFIGVRAACLALGGVSVMGIFRPSNISAARVQYMFRSSSVVIAHFCYTALFVFFGCFLLGDATPVAELMGIIFSGMALVSLLMFDTVNVISRTTRSVLTVMLFTTCIMSTVLSLFVWQDDLMLDGTAANYSVGARNSSQFEGAYVKYLSKYRLQRMTWVNVVFLSGGAVKTLFFRDWSKGELMLFTSGYIPKESVIGAEYLTDTHLAGHTENQRETHVKLKRNASSVQTRRIQKQKSRQFRVLPGEKLAGAVPVQK